MIYEVKMYGAQCDHCKKEWYDDHNSWTAMSDESAMDSVLNDEGWLRGDEKIGEGKDDEHYCPECWSYDDNDNLILAENRKDKHK